VGRFVKHEGCPECGSRDNVAVYDDGSKFCFGCHWWTHATTEGIFNSWSMEQLYQAEPLDKVGDDFVELPLDSTMELPDEVYRWLIQYIHPQEIMEHQIQWSPGWQRLIFPVYGAKNKLQLWSGRYFGKDKEKTKWYIQGRKSELLDVVSANILSNRVVFVEDRVSAIKVGRIASTMCLYGSKIPLEHARSLSRTFGEATIWLDSDKRREALRQALQLNSFFRQVKVVFSEKDPKFYENSKIAHFLGKA